MLRRALVVGLLCGLVATPAHAAAPWSDPVEVAGTSSADGYPSVAFAPSGRGLVTWLARGSRPGQASTRGALISTDGSFDRPRTLARSFAAINGIELLRGDRVLAVGLTRGEELSVASGDVEGALGPRRQLPGKPVVVNWVIAADPSGAAAILLESCPGSGLECRPALELFVRRPGGAFGRPVRLAGPGRLEELAPAVAINARGDVLAAWHREGSVHAQVRRADGRLLPRQRLTRNARDPIIEAALGADRHAVVTWDSQRRDDDGDSRAPAELFAAVAGSGRRFGRPHPLERYRPRGAIGGSFPALALPTGPGRAILVWTGQDGDRRVIRVADLSGDDIGAPQTLTAPTLDSILGGFAVGPRGQAIVLWLAAEDVDAEQVPLLAAIRPAGAAVFGATEEVASPRMFFGLDVAINPVTGAVMVVWGDLRDSDGGVMAATRLPQ